MPPSSSAARHRWFVGLLIALMGAAMPVWWLGKSPFVSFIGFTLLSVAALGWFVVGPSWVLAAAPARDADVTATARRFGRRVMGFTVVVRIVLEAIWWIATGAPSESGLVTRPIETALVTVTMAYVAGRMAQYQWLRRPPQAPWPWLLRVWRP